MRDGQVTVPLPLSLNTKEACVGQGRREHLSGSRSGNHHLRRMFTRGAGAHRKKKRKDAGVSCVPRVTRPTKQETSAR